MDTAAFEIARRATMLTLLNLLSAVALLIWGTHIV